MLVGRGSEAGSTWSALTAKRTLLTRDQPDSADGEGIKSDGDEKKKESVARRWRKCVGFQEKALEILLGSEGSRVCCPMVMWLCMYSLHTRPRNQ